MEFLKTLGKGLLERVFVHYKPTLIGIAASAGILLIDQFTTLLQSIPKPAVQAVAAVVVVVGAMLKQKLQAEVDAAEAKPTA